MNKLMKYVSVFAAFASSQVFAQTPDCDASCLSGIARQYMQDVAQKDWSRLPWADRVRHTENNVAMMIGEGFWGAGPSAVTEGITIADPSTGNVVWFGITAEHGQAAYHGLRLKVVNREITESELFFGREGQPDLFSATADYSTHADFTQAVPANQRTPRERMTALVDGWFNSVQLNDGKVFTSIADNCVRHVNGVNTTHGEYWAAKLAQGCRQQLEEGLFKPADRVRARRFPVVDEASGVVVALSLEDHAVRYVDYQSKSGAPLKVEVEYPNTRARLDLFKIVNGEITRIDGVSVFSPYYIHSLWND